jgi:glycosyltransferase involved in cell wall biosynthesis
VYWQKDAEWTTSSAVHPAWMRHCYRRLLRSADLVVTVSRRLHEIARANGVDSVIVPNGCDPAALQRDSREPAQFARIPKPRAVYAGRFNSRVDRDLFEVLARASPGTSFLVVGDVDNELPELPNIYSLGSVDFEELGAYLRLADVGLVPYAVNEFNAASRPLKIYDYLAAGLPVLTTGVDTFDLNPSVVVPANSPQDAVAKLAALLDTAPDLRDLAVLEASRNSWESRVDALLSIAYPVE